MALIHGDNLTFREVTTIKKHMEQTRDPERIKIHSMVAWSNGIVALLPLAIRSTDQGRHYYNQVEKEMEKSVARTKAIGDRKDIHYRGRLYLLALNNFRTCFNLICLFNLAVDKRSAARIEPIKKAWLENTGRKRSHDLDLVVTLTAVAEASFPVCANLAK